MKKIYVVKKPKKELLAVVLWSIIFLFVLKRGNLSRLDNFLAIGYFLNLFSLCRYKIQSQMCDHICENVNQKKQCWFFTNKANIYYAENIPILTKNRPAKCLTHQKSSGHWSVKKHLQRQTRILFLHENTIWSSNS